MCVYLQSKLYGLYALAVSINESNSNSTLNWRLSLGFVLLFIILVHFISGLLVQQTCLVTTSLCALCFWLVCLCGCVFMSVCFVCCKFLWLLAQTESLLLATSRL